jgi:lysine 2,3-aminomutase
VSIEQRPERWKRVPDALWHDWQWQREHVLAGEELLALGQELGLASRPSEADDNGLRLVLQRFPAAVTPYYAALSLASPQAVGAQWLPAVGELLPGGSPDPFADTSMPLPGVVHRFADRLLVAATRECAVRCRHCTRKGMLPAMTCFDPAVHGAALLDYVAAHPAVREIIVSGGDPLMLPDRRLRALLDVVTLPAQIESVRIGTRVPVVLPMRITTALSGWLGRYRKLWICTHFNHVDELTPSAIAAGAALVEAGIPMANQSVLLKGVNDTVGSMHALCTALQQHRIKPYYLFQCDPVAGIEHLRVDHAAACQIEGELAARLGGLAMPRFVRDLPDAPSKIDLRHGPSG